MSWSLSNLQPMTISTALWTPGFQLYSEGYHPLLSQAILCRFPRLGQREPLQLAPLSCAGSLSFSEHFLAFLHDKMFQVFCFSPRIGHSSKRFYFYLETAIKVWSAIYYQVIISCCEAFLVQGNKCVCFSRRNKSQILAYISVQI